MVYASLFYKLLFPQLHYSNGEQIATIID